MSDLLYLTSAGSSGQKKVSPSYLLKSAEAQVEHSSKMRSCQQVLPTVHNFRGPTPNTGDTQFILSSTNDSPQMIHSAFSSALVTYFPSQCAVSCCVLFI